MPFNALIHEKSPYLRQHAENPVQWLPWGPEAFDKARRENKPIFLSIGYSTCHWCHVMAHESFENGRVADVLNADFVPIKVDREERPDVDRIYMLFVQASTGSGGWPMSVWLTPDLKPFFGGTYFPPDSRYGRPGFLELLGHLANAWRTERDRIESSSVSVLDQLKSITGSARAEQDVDGELFGLAFQHFRRSFDATWGGFGSAPKFPRPVALNYLLRYHEITKRADALEMVHETLRGMAHGGMHDQLGGGFHRYSVDERWFVPHFEKMLYDQAQLAISYLEAFQLSHHEYLAEVARGIFDYVLRDMTDAHSGFFSAEDADSARPENPSEHGEGAFYVWTKAEIDGALGPDSPLFCVRYGVEDNGNVRQDPQGEFIGRNILYLARTLTEVASQTGIQDLGEPLARSRQKLFEVRAGRPRPHLDNKILTGWNALMISAFVKGYMVLGEYDYLNAAERAASFIQELLFDGNQLLRRFCEGDADVPAFLDDYAFLAQAHLDLFEATGTAEHLERSVALADRLLEKFEDSEVGGFFSTEAASQDLVLRIKDDYDGAEPSGNSVATDVLLRLAHLTGNDRFRASAEKSLRVFAPKLRAQPTIAPQMLVAAGRMLSAPQQVVIRCAQIDDEIRAILSLHWKQFQPWSEVLPLTDEATNRMAGIAPFLGSLERKGRITIYECRNFTCELPQIIE